MFDFKKCEICTEKRCDLAFLQETPKTSEELEEIEFQNKLKEMRNKKKKSYWIKEKKYWNKFKDREMALIKPNAKGNYTSESDWMHDANWFIAILKLGELDDQYYNNIEY